MVLLTLALLAQIAQADPRRRGASMQAPSAPPATGSAYAGAAGLEVIWAPTVAQAQESARAMKDGRILLFFTDDDCGECARMLKIIAPSTSFYAFTRDKVPVPVFIGKPDGLKLAQQMRVVGVPTWIVATPDLLECSRQEGVTTQQGWVEAFVAGRARLVRVPEGAGGREGEPGQRRPPCSRWPGSSSSAAHASRRRGASAGSRSTRLPPRTSASSRTRTSPRSTSTRGASTRRRGSSTTSSATRRTPQLRERAELRRADVEVARGRNDLAAYRLREFKKAHPDSPLAAEAQALLDALQRKPPARRASGREGELMTPARGLLARSSRRPLSSPPRGPCAPRASRSRRTSSCRGSSPTPIASWRASRSASPSWLTSGPAGT